MPEEMTVTEHNERLILQKSQLEAYYQEQMGTVARVIIGLMGRFKTKKLTAEQWEKTFGLSIQLNQDDDGGIVIAVLSPNGKIEPED